MIGLQKCVGSSLRVRNSHKSHTVQYNSNGGKILLQANIKVFIPCWRFFS